MENDIKTILVEECVQVGNTCGDKISVALNSDGFIEGIVADFNDSYIEINEDSSKLTPNIFIPYSKIEYLHIEHTEEEID
jgi:hypothetical protein